MHLAELNIGYFKYSESDPRLADFMNNLDRINALAERSPGFVWRLHDDSGNATAFRLPDAGDMAVNLSVWQDAGSLEKFVWQTVHKQFYARRAEWFSVMKENHFCMWWIDEGHIPDLEEAAQRLKHLQQHGPSAYSFGWENLDNVRLWKQAQCT